MYTQPTRDRRSGRVLFARQTNQHRRAHAFCVHALVHTACCALFAHATAVFRRVTQLPNAAILKDQRRVNSRYQYEKLSRVNAHPVAQSRPVGRGSRVLAVFVLVGVHTFENMYELVAYSIRLAFDEDASGKNDTTLYLMQPCVTPACCVCLYCTQRRAVKT